MSSKPFQMPVEVTSRTIASSGSRLSSFGFSGTIAHGAFEARKTVVSMMSNDSKSLYRNRRFVLSSDTTRLGWMIEAPGPQQSRLDEAVVFSGALSSAAEAFFSHHVVGGTIILPGVGYVEMAFAANTSRALTGVAFLRPCVLSGPGRGEKCVLRCTRRAGALEIASARGTKSSSFASCFAGTLANIEGSHVEAVSGRRFIKAPTRRRNLVVPKAIFGPRPRLLKSSPLIGGTAWSFSNRRGLCSSSVQLSRKVNPANVASNNITISHPARWQSFNSLRGTVLSRSCLLVAHASANK